MIDHAALSELADQIKDQSRPLRRAFAEHLRIVSKALRMIEGVDSGDLDPGDDEEALRACLCPSAELTHATAIAIEARKSLNTAIWKAADASTR